MFFNLNDYQLELFYPCSWTYTVIGADRAAVEQGVADVLGEDPYTLSYSHKSRTGKYCSLRLDLVVQTEEHRTGLFHALRRHPSIKIVI